MNKELEADVQGAMMAAKQCHVSANPLQIRYEFAEPEVVAGTAEQLRRETLRMLTEVEIREELEELFRCRS